jgi:hypothetical protein
VTDCPLTIRHRYGHLSDVKQSLSVPAVFGSSWLPHESAAHRRDQHAAEDVELLKAHAAPDGY